MGEIRSSERWIWSAIGNTTNLAARLESLTRQLEADVLIDGPTFEAARDSAAPFQRLGEVPIKGRRDPVAVFGFRTGPAVEPPRSV